MMIGAVTLSIGLAGCGSDTADVVVARVGHTSIAQGAVKHWMDIIAGEVSTAAGQPKPDVPIPPHYTACISYKRKYPAAASAERSASASVGLWRECNVEFQKEKLKALYFLISRLWVDGVAGELGANPSDRELHGQLASLVQRFPSRASARHFLVGARGTEADLLARLKVVVLAASVQRALEAQNRRQGLDEPERQRALRSFGKRFERAWRARTSCRPGYVVPICRQRYTPAKSASALTPPDVPLTRMTAE